MSEAPERRNSRVKPKMNYAGLSVIAESATGIRWNSNCHEITKWWARSATEFISLNLFCGTPNYCRVHIYGSWSQLLTKVEMHDFG